MDLFGLGGVREWGCDTQPYFFFFSYLQRETQMSPQILESLYYKVLKKKKSSIEMMFIYNRI